MVPLYIVLIVFLYLNPSGITFILGGVMDETTNVQKRETQNGQIIDLILDKLVEQSQALEHLVKITEEDDHILKRILEYISNKLEQPQEPEKIEVLTHSRRSYNIEKAVPEPPIIKFGENMRRYGSLIKNLIAKELNNEPDPIVYIENLK